jgi:hypothetical protein
MKEKSTNPWISILILILFLIMLSIRTVKRIEWYQFCQKFSMYGAVVKLDKPLIAGVDKIIRGEEAEKIIQGIANNLPILDETMEPLVFRIKVQNTSKKVLNPLAIKVQVYVNGYQGHADNLDQIKLDLKEDHDLLFQSDYKKLNTESPYEPGETKYGTYIFATEKRSILKKYTVIWGQDYAEKSQSTNLTTSTLRLLDYKDYAFLYFFVLSLLAILYSFIQRKRKRSDGFVKSLMLPNVFLLVLTAGLLFMMMEDAFVPYLYTKMLFVLVLPAFIYYFYVKYRYVIFFSFIREKDVAYIQEEFIKRMQWTNVVIEKLPDHVEITNKDTWETFHFYQDYVKKEDVKDSLAKAKEKLREIYLSLPIDRAVLYDSVLSSFFLTVFMMLFFQFL